MTQNFVSIFDIPFIDINRKDFVQLLEGRIQQQEKTFIVTANPIIVMEAKQNERYKQYVEKADFITADGSGIILASKLLNQPLPERVTGFDMMLDLLRIANEKKYRLFFLGAEQTVLERMLVNLKEEYPNLEIAGSHNGFFDMNDQTIVEAVQAANADLIFVALGVPRQEQWIAENLDKIDKGIFIGIGGSFDILAGNVKRAPEIWQKLNLEWFYRLMNQPSRWKRMLALPHFAGLIIIQKIKRNKVNIKPK